jgi:uncharacterized protein (TIGR02145 family)
MHSFSKHLSSLLLIFISFSVLITSCEKEEDDPPAAENPILQPPVQPPADTNYFVDSRDGNRYKYVKIGNQTWMAEDLKYLPKVFGPDSGSRTNPLYYVYGYNGTSVSEAKATANYQNYGVLYNWTAAMDSTPATQLGSIQGACPDGWHLPSNSEWIELVDYLGGRPVAGGKLKEAGTTHWRSPNVNATNESGFTALPAGNRNNQGVFEFQGENVIWWTSTPLGSNNAFIRNVYYNYGDIYRIDLDKELGFCVRCVQDGASGEGG